jgi:hypothetical protein
MATTSEIQVTEAYIGLLGRAPDPAGLAYWVGQYDNAVAAGQDATFALKKLMNDIAASPEYAAGTQGTNVPTTGNPSTAQAEAIVTDIYNNLFDRAATQADLDYWAPQLSGGSTTAPEMTINLITAAKSNANTTDADTLGLKQQAATYYVESVPQADFNRGTAANAVEPVNSPITLDASKDQTDVIVSGVGVTKALTTGADTISMTGGDDTVTGLAGTGATFGTSDTIADISTTDNDTLTITGDAEFDFGTVSNVENINISLGVRDVADNIDIDAANLSASDVNLTVAEEVTISGVTFAGEQTVDITNFDSNLTTTNVTGLTVTGASGTQTFTLDNDASTVSIAGVTANDTTVVLANNDVTLTISGTAATNDAMSITADNEVTIDNAGSDVELLTLSGSDNDAVFTITNVSDDATKMVYTAAGSNDITLSGLSTQFNGASLVDNNSGTETLNLTGGAAASIEGFGVLSGGVTVSAASDLKLASGNTVTTTTTATHKFDANDTATDSAITISVGTDTTSIETVKFESVTITSNDSKAVDLNALNFTDNSGAAVTISGANDITANTVTGADKLTISGLDVTLDGALTATNEVTLTAGNKITTGAMTTDNDITLTAGTATGAIDGNDVSIGGNITISSGALTATGDAVEQTAGTTVASSAVLTATNEVDMDGAITVATGNLVATSTGGNVELAAAVTATKGSVTVTAANDVDVNNITAAGAVDINAGSGAGMDVVDVDAIAITSGNFTVDGDDIKISGDTTSSAGDVVITAGNDANLDGAIHAAKGDVTVTANNDADIAGAITAAAGSVTITGSGVDGVGDGVGLVNVANITAQNDIDINAGTGAGKNVEDADVLTITGTGNLTIDGENVSDLSGDITVASGNVTITGNNDVTAGEDITATAGDVSLVATVDDLTTTTAKTIKGNDVALTAGDDITGAAAITAQNDVTITTTGSAGGANDIDQSGTVSTTGAGTVTVSGDAVKVKVIDAAKGNIVLDADDEVLLDSTLEATLGSITITADRAVASGYGVSSTAGDTILAQNDIQITAVSTVDLVEAVTSTAGDIVITGDEIATNGLQASGTGGSITLTATDSAAANLSVASGAISAVNVTLADGTHDVNEAITATGAFTISGDAGMDLAAGKILTAGSVNLTTANDVTINGSTDSVFIVGSGTGKMDLGSVQYTAATTDIDIVLGAGNDTMTLNDAGNKFLVQTNGGADSVTVASSAAGSVVNVGAGDDTVTLLVAENTKGTLAGGADTDKLVLATDDYSANTDLGWSGFEEIQLGNGTQAGTISAAQFNGNSSFKLLNSAGTLQVTGGATAETIDASNLTFAVGTTSTTVLTGGDGNDVITGADVVDVITGGGGSDTISGGTGADDFVFTEKTDGGVVNTDGAGDSVSGFVSTSDDVIIDGALEVLVADGGDGNLDFATITHGGGATALTLDGAANANEAIFIADAATFASADFTDLSDVAAYLETEITLTAAATVDALVVLESSTAGTFAVYYYLETGDTANQFDQEDLVLLGVFTGNDVVAADITF